MLRIPTLLFVCVPLTGCIGTAVGITKDVVVGTASIATDVVVGTVDVTTDVVGTAVDVVTPGSSSDDSADG